MSDFDGGFQQNVAYVCDVVSDHVENSKFNIQLLKKRGRGVGKKILYFFALSNYLLLYTWIQLPI